MIITTTETIPGKQIVSLLGIARGSTVRSKNTFRDMIAGMRSFIGGEIPEYTKLQAQSREEAIYRMVQDAAKLNANAIVNIRFSTSTLMMGASEILAYGTAVRVR